MNVPPPSAPARAALKVLDSRMSLRPHERRFLREVSRCWFAEALSWKQEKWLQDLVARADQFSASRR